MRQFTFWALLFSAIALGTAQNTQDNGKTREQGHYNISKFRQLKQELATPNGYRTASGAPGHEYYQQKADYKMDIVLDDEKQRIYGEETITYYNNSPDALEYLWVQLDQNIRAPDAKTKDVKAGGPSTYYNPKKFTEEFLGKPFDGGFKIDFVKDLDNGDLNYTINGTMMRIDLNSALQSGEKTSFRIKWWYNIPNHVVDRARSGYEHFEKDGNNTYIIAQFFPRMAVYNDVEGWQNLQFLGSLLTEHGYGVGIAQDGAAALEFVRTRVEEFLGGGSESVAYLHADICRRELQIEIDAAKFAGSR